MTHTIFTKHFVIPKNVKVISFDIFDTLILRPFSDAKGIFRFMSPAVSNIVGSNVDFAALRRRAERRARKKLSADETNLDEIYENFTKIPPQFYNQIKALEIETELKLCFPRSSGKIIYDMAKESGVKVIAASDIYLEKSILLELLNKNGFYFDEVFSSASLQKRKASGLMFPEIVKTMGVLPNEVLHIGDNYASDIVKAKEAGFETFYLPQACINPLYKNIKGNFQSIVQGLIKERADREINKVDKSSLFSNDFYNLGFNAFGSLLFGYSNWVFRKVKQNNIEKIFFVARDGYIMKKVFDVLFGDRGIETYYLECSRRSVLPLIINSIEDVINIFSTTKVRDVTLKEFIVNKLECDPFKIIPYLKGIGFNSIEDKVKTSGISKKALRQKIKKIIEFYAVEILEKMNKERPQVLEYLEKSGVLKGRVAVCDIGYIGTVQRRVESLRGKEGVFGLYLMTDFYSKQHDNIFGFLHHRASKFYFRIFITHIARLLEGLLLGAPHGTVLNYNADGKPQHDILSNEEKEKIKIQELIWKGVIDFNIQIKERFGSDFEFIPYDRLEISKTFLSFCFTPEMKDAKMLENIIFENKFSSGGYRFLIEDDLWRVGSIAIKNPLLYKVLRPAIKTGLKLREIYTKLT